MKDLLKFRFISLVFLSVFLFTFFCQKGYAQDAEKNSVRLTVNYTKIMDGEAYLDIRARSRINKVNTEVPNIELSIINELEDEEIVLGSTTTNMHGSCRFVLKDRNTLKPDTTNIYNIIVSFKGNDAFKRSSKSISFKDANLYAKIITMNGENSITATLKNAADNSPIIDESLIVQVERLFRPLGIGEEFNYTDENGTILVPIEEGIPGVDGNLIIEVVLYESDDYGTVVALVNAPLGTPIVDESTFEERTMWSPPNKTPLFLLITSNLLILAVWGTIVYLIINLFKIYKAKI